MSDQLQADFVTSVHIRPDGSARAGPENPAIEAELAALRIELRKVGYKESESTQGICKRVLLLRNSGRDSICAADAKNQKWPKRCGAKPQIAGQGGFRRGCGVVFRI